MPSQSLVASLLVHLTSQTWKRFGPNISDESQHATSRPLGRSCLAYLSYARHHLLACVACVVHVRACFERGSNKHEETRCCISSAIQGAERAGQAVRGHWGIENRPHWVLDVTSGDGQSGLRKGLGARTMAVVRHFALNLVRSAKETKSIKLHREIAGWTPAYLDNALNERVA